MSIIKSLRTQAWHLRKGGIGQWRRHRLRSLADGRAPRLHAPTQSREAANVVVDVPEWQVPRRAPRRDLRVGIIADDFTRLCLDSEWIQMPLSKESWRDQLGERAIDLLFVESAWNGNAGSWKYAMTGSKAPAPELRELVSYCRAAGVPTVFWAKEDPVHFEDFLETARLFDHVLTTEAEKVDEYIARLGHDRVATMPFAAASWIHNPVRLRSKASRDIAFAGMYYRERFPERRAQMDLLLGAAQRVSHRMQHGLEIFSRFLGTDDKYQFPKEFAGRVVGELSYPQMLTAYRDYKVFLNVSSVPESTTMCPRRLFEISACATPVVSTPTPAISAVFDEDEMVTVSDPQEAEWLLRALVRNDEWRERLGHRASRKVLSAHTYRHRVDDLLGRVGLDGHRTHDPSISVIASTNRPRQLGHLLRSVASQTGARPQLVLVTHGFSAPADLQELARDLGIDNLIVQEVEGARSLGECLNIAVGRADGDVVTKMDDDDLYGPHYLSDQLLALDYSGAQVVGKQAHHMLIESSGALMVRFPEREHRFTDFVMGPTLMMRRELASATPFESRTTGEDTAFLRAVVRAGGQIYSSDRFGFIQVRTSRGHTWQAKDAELLANGEVVAFGAGPEHVFV